MRQGVPFDVAMDLDDDYRTAFAIIMGEIEGGEWDWSLMQFREPE